MNRRTFLNYTVAFGLSLAALGSGEASALTPEDIEKKGVLVVGIMPDFPPFGFINAEGVHDGYDADVAKALAEDLGVKVEIVPVRDRLRMG